jgi:hypothetical protein
MLVKVVDVDFQNTVIPYFHRAPLIRRTKHIMALDGIRRQIFFEGGVFRVFGMDSNNWNFDSSVKTRTCRSFFFGFFV